MFCEKCGYKLREDGCFCENCGTRFSKVDFEEKETYNNNYEISYKINRIKNLPKILIAAYIIEFVAIIIVCIFPITFHYFGIDGDNRISISFSVKFLILTAIFLILGIIIDKKIIFHIITVVLYFLPYKPGLLREYIDNTIIIHGEPGNATSFYYISVALMLISLIIVIIYEIYRRKSNCYK